MKNVYIFFVVITIADDVDRIINLSVGFHNGQFSVVWKHNFSICHESWTVGFFARVLTVYMDISRAAGAHRLNSNHLYSLNMKNPYYPRLILLCILIILGLCEYSLLFAFFSSGKKIIFPISFIINDNDSIILILIHHY